MRERVEERIDESVLWWFGPIKRMRNNSIIKKAHVGECVITRLLDRLWKRWVESVECVLEKKKRFECWASKEDGV